MRRIFTLPSTVSQFAKAWAFRGVGKVGSCPLPQCHIKARALRAAAQGPHFIRGPRSNVFVNLLNIKHKFLRNFVLIHYLESNKYSRNNDYVTKTFMRVKIGPFLKEQPRAPICLLTALLSHWPCFQTFLRKKWKILISHGKKSPDAHVLKGYIRFTQVIFVCRQVYRNSTYWFGCRRK